MDENQLMLAAHGYLSLVREMFPEMELGLVVELAVERLEIAAEEIEG